MPFERCASSVVPNRLVSFRRNETVDSPNKVILREGHSSQLSLHTRPSKRDMTSAIETFWSLIPMIKNQPLKEEVETAVLKDASTATAVGRGVTHVEIM